VALSVIEGTLIARYAYFRGCDDDGLCFGLGGKSAFLSAGRILVVGKSAEAGYQYAAEYG
jgi:hypothetical protein